MEAIRGGYDMQLLRSKRFRCVCWLVAMLAIALGGFWTYVVATRDFISETCFRRLKTNMTLAEVEAILGCKASEIEDVRGEPNRFERFDFEIWTVPSIIPPGGPKMGAILDLVKLKQPKSAEMPAIAEEHTWDGPEGRITVALDNANRVVGGCFSQRVTWRYKLRQWLPWLK
jgi:hypothetical protein